MSEKKSSGDDWLNGFGLLAGIICALAGYGQGGWGMAIVAFFLGWGAVLLAAKFIGWLIAWLIGGVILLVMFAVLSNRVEWLRALFQ